MHRRLVAGHRGAGERVRLGDIRAVLTHINAAVAVVHNQVAVAVIGGMAAGDCGGSVEVDYGSLAFLHEVILRDGAHALEAPLYIEFLGTAEVIEGGIRGLGLLKLGSGEDHRVTLGHVKSELFETLVAVEPVGVVFVQFNLYGDLLAGVFLRPFVVHGEGVLAVGIGESAEVEAVLVRFHGYLVQGGEHEQRVVVTLALGGVLVTGRVHVQVHPGAVKADLEVLAFPGEQAAGRDLYLAGLAPGHAGAVVAVLDRDNGAVRAGLHGSVTLGHVLGAAQPYFFADQLGIGGAEREAGAVARVVPAAGGRQGQGQIGIMRLGNNIVYVDALVKVHLGISRAEKARGYERREYQFLHYSLFLREIPLTRVFTYILHLFPGITL